MNTLDSRISEALRAQADQLTEQELTPMAPPLGREPHTGWSMPILAAAAVVLLATGGTVAVRAATGSGHRPSAPPAAAGRQCSGPDRRAQHRRAHSDRLWGGKPDAHQQPPE